MMDKITLAFLLLLASVHCHSCYGQKDFSNSVEIGGTDYYQPDELRKFALIFFYKDHQQSIYYKRRLYKNFFLKGGCTIWNNINCYPNAKSYRFFAGADHSVFAPGVILSSGRFQMIDLYVSRVINIGKNNKMTSSLGFSRSWGYAEVIDSITVFPGYNDALISSHSEKKHYWGLIPAISFDHLIFKRRFSIGADLRYRNYFGYYFKQWEYGIHYSFNF